MGLNSGPSQKPVKGQAQFILNPAGFVESLIGSIAINNAFLGKTSRSPTGLETNWVNPSPTRYLISKPEPDPGPIILKPF